MISLADQTRFLSQLLAIAIAVGLSQAAALGQYDPSWGSKMLEVKEIQFGSVAKGSDAAVQVKVKNIYKEEIQITNLRGGLGPFGWDNQPQNSLPIVIPSGQQRMLTLWLNTIQFDGKRKTMVYIDLLDTVHLASTTVVLPVEANIRGDVVFAPGRADFGVVELGSEAKSTIQIQYAGRNDWKLTQVKVANPHLTAAFRELSRSEITPGKTQVKYELAVTLSSQAPVGMLRDQIILVTDEVDDSQLPVIVKAKIEPEISITDVNFGTIAPGQSKTIPVVIRGRKPFKIDELYREKKDDSKIQDEAFKVKLDKISSTVHSLPVTFTAPDVPGVYEEQFFVKIDDRPLPVPFKARGRILEQTGAAKK